MRISSKREERWIILSPATEDAPEARLLVRPYSSLGRGFAGEYATRCVAAGGNIGEANVAWSVGLANWASLDWEGIGDDDGAPLPFSREGVEALLEQHDKAFAAFERLYVQPALLEDAEKNGSSPSPDGTSPAGAMMTTATASPGAAETTAADAESAAPSAPTS